MFAKSFIVNTVILILFTNVAQAQTRIVKHDQNQTLAKTDAIGRLLSDNDRNKPLGSLIFPGDRIDPNSGKVKVLCYLNQKILLLGQGAVDDTADKCVDLTQIKKCIPNLENKNKCSNTRAVNQQAKILILKPYGRIILNPRPLISWQQVPGATSYTISLYGRGVQWSTQTTSTTLLYPDGESPMKPGNTYKLSVIANKGNSSFNGSSSILFIVPGSQIQEVANTIDQIHNLNLSPDQQARDLDTIFMSKNLLTPSINILSERIKAGTNNPTLYRLLGDRYVQAGFLQKAKPIYIKAIMLAQKANKPNELQLAQTRLKLINDQL